MPIIGSLLKKSLKVTEYMGQDHVPPFDLQRAQLKKLVKKAKDTKFGKHYRFDLLLKKFRKNTPRDFYTAFKETVPIHSYNKMYNEWWHMSRAGEKDVAWPGGVKYFALSSGTSEASSKYIPLTAAMKKANQKTSLRQVLTLSRYDLPKEFFESGLLWLGGSTKLSKKDTYYEGDLSGIQAARLPFWIKAFYKPGKKIAKSTDWLEKLNAITLHAKEWNIGTIIGVPAWVQLLLERIIEHYNVKHIHEIWPNFSVYGHGGVSFDPYRKGFEKLLGKPVHFIETYPASEGFIAYQAAPNRRSMRMVLDNGLFYEFIPFDEKNFDEQGEVRPDAKTLLIDEVEQGKDYALLLSNNAGAWRYLIGDVIRFVSKAESEIVITGRTKHYLSLCGEHLSVDNMNKAIELVADELNVEIKEFTVAGIPHDSLFAHHWFIGTDQPVDRKTLQQLLDKKLCELNDDYAVERSAALKEVFIDIIPAKSFYDWMDSKGKSGGQHKFPRVMRSEQFSDWKSFLQKTNAWTPSSMG